MNDLPDRFFNAANTQTSAPNPFRGVLPGNTTLGQGDTIRIDRLRRQFPQFNDVMIIGGNTGRVRYHALQTGVQKQLSSGLQFVAHYTFSKAMLYTGGSLVNERHNNKSVAATDFPQIFRVFATYDLPIGHGRAFGGEWPGWLDSLFGGWNATWITRYTSGMSLGETDTRGRPIPIRDPRLGGSVKDRLGDGPIDPVTGFRTNPYLDRTAFISLPTDFSISPEPVRYGWLRGPSRLAHSLTVFKTFHIVERLRLELRSEINNIFNSPQFDNPINNNGSLNLASKATFGVINSAGGSRAFQIGAKLKF